MIEPLFRVFNNRGLLKGFLWSLCRSFTNTLVRSFWLRKNVTLESFLFLRKFVANFLSWNNSFFPCGNVQGVIESDFIDKFVNEWKHINWLNKVNVGKTNEDSEAHFVVPYRNNIFEWAIVKLSSFWNAFQVLS